MRRPRDLEREILLAVEADENVVGEHVIISGIEGYSEQQIGYQVGLLRQAGLLESIDGRSDDAPFEWHPQCLTMAGHQYREAIRDPEIWRKTKEGASMAGSFSIELLGKLANGFIRTQIKKHTGFDIE